MVAYAKGLDTFSLPRPRSKLPESKLTPVEHRGFRKVLGQLQWTARMMCYEEACTSSLLAAALAAPTIKDIMEANAAMRRIRKMTDASLIYAPCFDPAKAIVVCVHDAGFDNVPWTQESTRTLPVPGRSGDGY